MTATIRPAQSTYPPAGPPPSFIVGAGLNRLYDIQLSIDPILFNAANGNRRHENNFLSSFTGTKKIAPLRAPAAADLTFYDMPPAAWALLRRAPALYYRVKTFDAGGKRQETSLDDLDYERAPFVILLAGVNRLLALADITPSTPATLGADPPPPLPAPVAPTFTVRGGTQLYYTVELASDPALFFGLNTYKRNQANFFSSWWGMPGVPSEERQTIAGVDQYTLPALVWQRLRGAPRLYYRAITTRSVLGLGKTYSVDESTLARAPSIILGQIGAAAPAAIDHVDARMLPAGPPLRRRRPEGEPAPPALSVRGDGRTRFEIELASSSATLLAGAGAPHDYFKSSLGGVVPAENLTLLNQFGAYVFPEDVWGALNTNRFIYYRVTTFDLDAVGARTNVSRSPVDDAHRMPGIWGGLPLDSASAPFIRADGKIETIRLESDHGPRWVAQGRLWHPGIDLPLNLAPVHAIAAGAIDNRGTPAAVHASDHFGWIRLDHGTHKSSYLHMQLPFASAMPAVQGAGFRRGQQLALSDTQGTAGAHLHFELEDTGKNPLNRVRHTETPGMAPGMTQGPIFSGSAADHAMAFTVEMKAAHAGTDPIAILSIGVSTGADKDLQSVDVRILDRLGVAEPGQAFLLDYTSARSVAGADGMLSSIGSGGRQSVAFDFAGSSRPVGAGLPALTAATQQEILIAPGTAAAGANPAPLYAALAAGGSMGAPPHPIGWWDMYVIPGFTTQNAVAEDWFNYMWHVNGYRDDSGPHRIVVLATDLKGNSSALLTSYGVELAAVTDLVAPAGADFAIRLHNFDYRAAPVQLLVRNVPPGWAALPSWGAGPVVLPANGETVVTVTLTPPAAAPVGASAQVQLVARSTRLAGSPFRDAILLGHTVGPPPGTPRILLQGGPIFNEGLPPIFRIEAGADTVFCVEVSDRADFYGGRAPSPTSSFFRSDSMAVAGGVATFVVPDLAWQRLAAPVARRLYYRVRTAPDASWTGEHVSATSSFDLVTAWPFGGPEIDPLHALNTPAGDYRIAPSFHLHLIPKFFYAVEVATRPELFFEERSSANEHNFFSSWFGNSVVPARPLISDSGYAVYHVPDGAWDQLKQEFIAGRAARLHYVARQGRVASDIFGTLSSSTLAFLA